MLEKPVEPFEQLLTAFNALFDAYLETCRLQNLYETRLTIEHEATRKVADVRAAVLYAVRLLHGDVFSTNPNGGQGTTK